MAWGNKYVKKVSDCIQNSQPIHQYDIFLITDQTTPVDENAELFTKIIRTDFEHAGLLRKTELTHFIPAGYHAYLFLDSDIIVLEDISLGFEKAKQFMMALSPSPHYSLNDFWNFDSVMKEENIPLKGQLQYNSGVIFFTNTSKVKEIFKRWNQLAKKHQFHNDQPLLTMAMEQADFNPYTLSPSYNCRGFGELLCGKVYLWHSHLPMPEKINDFETPWPPRRIIGGRIEYFAERTSIKKIILSRFKKNFRKLLLFISQKPE